MIIWTSKKFDPKNWLIGLALRAGKSWPKRQKPALTVTSATENSNPNQKNFSIKTTRLAESLDGLNTFLALSPGELWLK